MPIAPHARARTTTIICAVCQQEAPRTGNVQKYCAPCSAEQHRLTQAKWARQNPSNYDPVASRERSRGQRSDMLVRGAEVSAANRTGMGSAITPPDLAWVRRISYPFSYSASKNAIYSSRGGGHVFLRKEAKVWRDGLIMSVAAAMRGVTVKQNKLWLDIFVQKPDARGDAVNVVDLVCDAIKKAVDLDDRWFSIRHLDWEIVKKDPQMFIGIGQEDVDDVQVCSYCGRLLDLSMFVKKKTTRMGVSRECRECRSTKSVEAA